MNSFQFSSMTIMELKCVTCICFPSMKLAIPQPIGPKFVFLELDQVIGVTRFRL